MQKLCSQDPTGKGKHCFCMDIDAQRGVKKCCQCNQWNVQLSNDTRGCPNIEVKKCCQCNQWNVQGSDWTTDEDFR